MDPEMSQIHRRKCHEDLIISSFKLQWDMSSGDAILLDRWAFHRTVVTVAEDEDQKPNQCRHSVRHMPGNARAFEAVSSLNLRATLRYSPI